MGIFDLFRKRATVRVTDPDALSFLGGRASRSGVRVSEQSALGLPSLYRGVSLVADKVAGLDLFVLKNEERGSEPAPSHPAYKLLRVQANPYQSALVLKTTLQKDKMVYGNGYCWVERDEAARPIALWRLDPSKTFPVQDGGVLYYASVISEEAVKLLPSDVVHIRRIGDGIVGFSILDLMKDMLGGAIATQRHEAVFFRNGASPTFAFRLPDGITEQDIKRFRQDWARLQTGVENHHKIALLPAGFDVQNMGLSPSEFSLVDLKKFSLIDIANLVGVPPSFLGSEVNSSYASWEADAKSLLDNSISGHLNDWEAELCIKLLSERQKDRDTHCIRFDRSKLEDTDNDKVVETATKKLQAGGISFNEYRRVINEAPISEEWADKYIMPSNLVFVEKAFSPPEPPQPIVQSLDEETDTQGEDVQALDGESEDSEKLEAVTRSICDRLAVRLRKAIDSKGTHDLCEAHLSTMAESLGPINERSGNQMNIRHIYVPELEIRERNGESYFAGYAAVFGEEIHLFADAYERFDTQAFEAISDQVVECWYDHKADMKLGTTAVQGSLMLSVDEKGLFYQQRFNPQDADHVYVRSKIQSGLCGGSSLGFRPTKQKWIREDGKDINVIEKCWVRDVGPTPNPYYKTTSAQVRSESDLTQMKRSWETW
ncbi:Portal protein (GP3), partial [Durusdinium trenchii]